MNDTVKGNILFGSKEQRHRYNTSIAACALKHDLEMLSAGVSCNAKKRSGNAAT